MSSSRPARCAKVKPSTLFNVSANDSRWKMCATLSPRARLGTAPLQRFSQLTALLAVQLSHCPFSLPPLPTPLHTTVYENLSNQHHSHYYPTTTHSKAPSSHSVRAFRLRRSPDEEAKEEEGDREQEGHKELAPESSARTAEERAAARAIRDSKL